MGTAFPPNNQVVAELSCFWSSQLSVVDLLWLIFSCKQSHTDLVDFVPSLSILDTNDRVIMKQGLA